MKNDSTATFLNFVLAALVILGVVLALFSIFRSRDLRAIQPELQQKAQLYQMQAVKFQTLMNDVVTFNATAKNPELNQIIQAAMVQPQPAAK